VQEVEEAITSLYYYSMLDNASGITLDTLGEVAGVARVTGEIDSDYRNRIKARVIINSSSGNLEAIISILKTYVLSSPLLIEEYAATVFIRVDSPHIFTGDDLQDVQRTAPIGVAVILLAYDTSEVFTLGSGTSSNADSVHGLGSGTDSLSTGSGGKMANILI
jgi:hypothetical protein